jgi:hypothetical protein
MNRKTCVKPALIFTILKCHFNLFTGMSIRSWYLVLRTTGINGIFAGANLQSLLVPVQNAVHFGTSRDAELKPFLALLSGAGAVFILGQLLAPIKIFFSRLSSTL